MNEQDERMEAGDRVSRYYEIIGGEEPSRDSEEWCELFAIELERVQREGW